MRAPTPVPTITAVGVARPSAQGHAITTTETPKRAAKTKGDWPGGTQALGTPPRSTAASHAAAVVAAATSTQGAKMPDTQSAKACTGALAICDGEVVRRLLTRLLLSRTAGSPPFFRHPPSSSPPTHLRPLHRQEDLREDGLPADELHAHEEHARADVNRRADDGVPGGLAHRHRLPRQEALVDLRGARFDDAVCGDRAARGHAQKVPGCDEVKGDRAL